MCAMCSTKNKQYVQCAQFSMYKNWHRSDRLQKGTVISLVYVASDTNYSHIKLPD